MNTPKNTSNRATEHGGEDGGQGLTKSTMESSSASRISTTTVSSGNYQNLEIKVEDQAEISVATSPRQTPLEQQRPSQESRSKLVTP